MAIEDPSRRWQPKRLPDVHLYSTELSVPEIGDHFAREPVQVVARVLAPVFQLSIVRLDVPELPAKVRVSFTVISRLRTTQPHKIRIDVLQRGVEKRSYLPAGVRRGCSVQVLAERLIVLSLAHMLLVIRHGSNGATAERSRQRWTEESSGGVPLAHWR